MRLTNWYFFALIVGISATRDIEMVESEDWIMIRLISCDLDGTLLDEHECIFPESGKMLRNLFRNGTIIVLATGRSWRSALNIQQQLGIVGPIIAHDGGYVFDTSKNLELYKRIIPRPIAGSILHWGTQHQVKIRYYLGYGKPVLYNFAYDASTTSETLLHPSSPINVEPLEMYIFGETEIEKTVTQLGYQGFGYEINVFPHPDYRKLTINPPAVNKVHALSALCSLVGVDRQEVMAIGDGDNDIQMIKWAGTGIAMGHGVAECANFAAYVTSNQVIEEPVLQGLIWASRQGLLSLHAG